MSSRRTTLGLRAGILALAFECGLIAVHALFFPVYFYQEFFLGRGWVQMLPPYNEHVTRDLGALYFGLMTVLVYAAVRLSRDLVDAAMVATVVATAPHLAFHAAHTEAAPALLDRVLQVGLLGLTLVLAAALKLLAHRHFKTSAPDPATKDAVR